MCEEMEAAITLPELEEGVGPAFTSLADRRLVDNPSLDVNDMDRGDACSAELTISKKKDTLSVTAFPNISDNYNSPLLNNSDGGQVAGFLYSSSRCSSIFRMIAFWVSYFNSSA